MGYLFPGLTVLYILYYFYSCRWDLFQAIRVNVLCNTIDEIDNKFSFEKSVLIIIIAYIIGHLVSYVSSLTIEILSNRFFGYPSKYLLQKERPKYEQLWANYFKVKVDSSWKPMKIIKSTFVWIVYLFIFLILLPISPQYTLSVKGLRKAYTKMYTKRPEFSQFGAFLCLKCRVHSCTPVYMKKPRHKAGAHCSPMQLWGFATMWCKGSEDFTESFLFLQESSLSN